MSSPILKAESSNIDAVVLSKIHPRLILCSKNGSELLTGNSCANITVASEIVCRFLKHHPSQYRACVYVGDTLLITYSKWKEIFELASSLLNNALKSGLHVALSCHMGINRSTCTILMYCIRKGMDLEKCLLYIRRRNKEKRNLPALTNTTFYRYLKRYAREGNYTKF